MTSVEACNSMLFWVHCQVYMKLTCKNNLLQIKKIKMILFYGPANDLQETFKRAIRLADSSEFQDSFLRMSNPLQTLFVHTRCFVGAMPSLFDADSQE